MNAAQEYAEEGFLVRCALLADIDRQDDDTA